METLSSEGCRKSAVPPGCVRAGGGQDPTSPSITCSAVLPCSSPGAVGWEPGGSFSLPELAGLCPTWVSPASWRRENPFKRGSCSSKIRLWPPIAPRVSLQSTQPGQASSPGHGHAGISVNGSAGTSLSQILTCTGAGGEGEHASSSCTGTLRARLRDRGDRSKEKKKKKAKSHRVP